MVSFFVVAYALLRKRCCVECRGIPDCGELAAWLLYWSFRQKMVRRQVYSRAVRLIGACRMTSGTLWGRLWYFSQGVSYTGPWQHLNTEPHLNQYRCGCNCLARQQSIGQTASPPSDQVTNAFELTWGTWATSKCGLGLEDWGCFTPTEERKD